MAKKKRINDEDRRSARRVPASEVIPQAMARLATGQEVKLINISLNGAVLIHSNTVLSPGSLVRLRLKIPGSLINLEGRTQRCRVVALKQSKVKYEAAIILFGEMPQPLADRLKQLDEEHPQSETASPQNMNHGSMPFPDTAELWISNPQSA
jgi:hypothetical protein